MLKFEWNALRSGDLVQVHDEQTAESVLTAGTVVMVVTKRGKRAANGVGIRVPDVDGSHVVWPSHLTVHRVPIAADDDCWRCDALAKATVAEAAAVAPAGAVAR